MSFKYYKTTPLIITIIILAGLIDLCVVSWINPFLSEYLPAGSHFRVPTTVSLLGIVLLIYNDYLWKYPILNLLMDIPDLSGRYEGAIRYLRDGVDKEKKCFIEITQSASKIKVHSYFSDGVNENTSSKSLVEDIKKEEDKFFDLYLFYLNSGTKQNGGLDCHEGAQKLRFIPGRNGNNAQLIGHYFTNRLTQTRGEIVSTFVSKHLEGKF
jgi:hypothetical protein